MEGHSNQEAPTIATSLLAYGSNNDVVFLHLDAFSNHKAFFSTTVTVVVGCAGDVNGEAILVAGDCNADAVLAAKAGEAAVADIVFGSVCLGDDIVGGAFSII